MSIKKAPLADFELGREAAFQECIHIIQKLREQALFGTVKSQTANKWLTKVLTQIILKMDKNYEKK